MVKDLWQTKRSIMKEYDLTAKNYDLRYREEQLKKYDAVLSRINAVKGGAVLDVGCGTGMLAERLAESASYVVAIDFSKAMLKKAGDRCKALHNVFFIRGDADHLPLKGDAFDNAFAFTLLQNVPEPTRTVEELIRVAKHGSWLAISCLKKKYTEIELTDLVKVSNLRLLELMDCDYLKDYILICKKGAH